eukprot:scaffold205622_cov31-Tisochrysis_lutea.AAC.3
MTCAQMRSGKMSKASFSSAELSAEVASPPSSCPAPETSADGSACRKPPSWVWAAVSAWAEGGGARRRRRRQHRRRLASRPFGSTRARPSWQPCALPSWPHAARPPSAAPWLAPWRGRHGRPRPPRRGAT